MAVNPGQQAVSLPDAAAVAPAPAVVPAEPVTQLQAAASESKDESKVLTILGHSFRLMPKIGLGAMSDLDASQRTGEIKAMIDAAAKLIVKADRERFIEFMMDEPDDPDQMVDLDIFLEAIDTAVAQVVGRPTNSAGS